MKKTILLFVAVNLIGCSNVPPTNIIQPMTIKPLTQEYSNINGSIFSKNKDLSLFKDINAHSIGDIVTVKIIENTNATNKSNNKLDRSSSNSTSIPIYSGLPGQSLITNIGLDSNSKNTFFGNGNSIKNNTFFSVITVTIIDVFSNGNLLISGEKQISIDNNTEFIRLSGIINPIFINSGNIIESSKIADLKIEYKNSGQINDSINMPWLSRIFMKILPF